MSNQKCPHCGADLIDKEVFYGHCLACDTALPEEEDPNQLELDLEDGKDSD